MSTFIVHLEIALLFAIVFGIGTIIWDFDHLIKCKGNFLFKALSNQQDPEYQYENQTNGGCRGFTHAVSFGIAFTALYLGYLVHMIMDRVGVGI